MIPDRWFVDELARMDKDLVVVWNPKTNRWQIRQWVLPHHKGNERDYSAWRVRSLVIRNVCYLDEDCHDVGYHPLDQRVLYALKLSRHYSMNPTQTARMVDESNAKLEAEYQADNKDISREVAKSIYAHYREPSINLGQKSPY